MLCKSFNAYGPLNDSINSFTTIDRSPLLKIWVIKYPLMCAKNRHIPIINIFCIIQCSATCGRGTSIRPLSCPAEDEILCGPKPQERHKKCRLRRCPPIRPPPSCQGSDASQYCELFPSEQLTRNCIVPLFRNYCCNACRENDIFSMHRGWNFSFNYIVVTSSEFLTVGVGWRLN